jgi:uncharacterized protein (DUF2267 family)
LIRPEIGERMSTQSLLHPTLDVATDWLDGIARRTPGREDLAFAVLRAVLHALRDRLPQGELLKVAQDLPALVRGVWFEGWAPRAPIEDATLADWLVTLEGHLLAADADAVPPREAAMAVFAVLKDHLGPDRSRPLAAVLPPDLAALLAAAA